MPDLPGMELLNLYMMDAKKDKSIIFILIGMLALLAGLFFGAIGAFQMIFPDFLSQIPFYKARPLHVSLVVSWIFLIAIGGIYYYVPRYLGLKWYSQKLIGIHLVLFVSTGIAILLSYLYGRFGGREYWEFPPLLSLPIFLSWILFAINFYKTIFRYKGSWPVYLWMWASGIVFFFLTFLEANAWILDYVSGNIVREITIQWKAYGALVGSWNLLVYGTAIFLMERISGDTKMAYSRMAFLLYFLGLTNLIFGWAHHTYIVPSAPWIRHLAYGVSMTELLIFGKIIWDWKKSLSTAKKWLHLLPYKFLFASDIWIFLNLGLALIMSVPGLNLITHGTHITVAHAMGTTIGINSMILLSSIFYVLKGDRNQSRYLRAGNSVKYGYWLLNISLAVFWFSLITAGLGKGLAEKSLSFQEIMQLIDPYLRAFAFSGLGLMLGLFMILIPAIYSLQFKYRDNS